ncbi:hypothetical protein NMQ03_18490 [Arthrobacter sp. DNA4]|uniref:hypothetical protein n=1 Tax=Arthrobacter sp. DNA4 TaxID=2963432 RepID=UPI0020CD2AB6|nr:hypothetical protein [Arthrobacter sp. DNA4]UTT69155.1 hypothetical protein NMQ03_18490 [Arthrobacter sp. DNA4]
MTVSSDDPQNTADLRGPGDPDEAREAAKNAPQSGQHPEQPGAANIREEQQVHAAGTVPAAYVGGGDAAGANKPEESKPEEALGEPGTWDDEV